VGFLGAECEHILPALQHMNSIGEEMFDRPFVPLS